jgi:hypothetical protein
MRPSTTIKLSIAALVAAVLFGGPIALAQQSDIPSVAVRPAGTATDDPGTGSWFVLALAPGETGRLKARLTNTAEVAQHVTLSITDLLFDNKGNVAVNDGRQTDVGAWGRFDKPDIVIPPKTTVDAEFSITPPAGADPGDHVGSVLVVSDPQGTNLKVIKRVSTRLYVTLPGEAIRSMKIESIGWQLDSGIWPKHAIANVSLRNTGRVRLQPNVNVRGQTAKGSRLILTHSVEQYFADVKVPWYGGFIRLPVVATADGGLTRRVDASRFVMPWAVLIILAVIAGAVVLGKRWWDARVSRMGELRADIRRIETLVTQRPGPSGQMAPEPESESELEREVAGILGAMKRAQRTGATASFERLALALHELNGGALDSLLEAIQKSEGAPSRALMDAAASYGPRAVSASSRFSSLPVGVADDLMGLAGEGLEASAGSAEAAGPQPEKAPVATPDKAAAARTSRKPAAPTHRGRSRKAGKRPEKKPARTVPRNQVVLAPASRKPKRKSGK